jgi:hypothetical protein
MAIAGVVVMDINEKRERYRQTMIAYEAARRAERTANQQLSDAIRARAEASDEVNKARHELLDFALAGIEIDPDPF